MSATSQESDSAVCPTCGRDDFASERGMKWHHSTMHGESISSVEFECDWCGDTASRHINDYERTEHHFCSDECQNEWQSSNFTGEDSPTWKGGLVEFDCEWCGETAEKPPSEYERLDHHFCSRECFGSWKSENHVGEECPAWKGGLVEFDCDWCGETAEKPRCHFERNEHNFCSNECDGAWKSEHISGENSVHWQGGYLSIWGTNWKEKRRRVRERDDHVCQRCGDDGDDRRLNVHHLIPRRLFLKWDTPDIEEANVLRNLIALCAQCHQKVERTDEPSPVPDSHWRSE